MPASTNTEIDPMSTKENEKQTESLSVVMTPEEKKALRRMALDLGYRNVSCLIRAFANQEVVMEQ